MIFEKKNLKKFVLLLNLLFVFGSITILLGSGTLDLKNFPPAEKADLSKTSTSSPLQDKESLETIPRGSSPKQELSNTGKSKNWYEALALIIYSDAVMSVENVLVIAVLVSNIPQRIRVIATFSGLLAAGLFRAVFASLTTILMKFSVVGILGAIALIFLSLSMFADTFKLMRKNPEDRQVIDEKFDFTIIKEEFGRLWEPGFWKTKEGEAFQTVCYSVILQDILLSLDNVLVVAGNAHGDMFLTILGVGISILMMATIANLMVKIAQKYPIVGLVGGVALAKAASNLFVESYDPESATVALGAIVIFAMFTRIYKKMVTADEELKPLSMEEADPFEEIFTDNSSNKLVEKNFNSATELLQKHQHTGLVDKQLVEELIKNLNRNNEILGQIEKLIRNSQPE
ncbi:MAG: hypothetical protein HQM08_23165 [Candidatus Riflebacteria bacterium]|nr:hypothetical protein [Candidatus Riflebacteria bacterium]